MDYLEEYIRIGEPGKRDRAQAWQMAIGLQAVDGLQTSEYLRDTAVRHIEGEITVGEAQQLIHAYYQTKVNRTPQDDGMEEADKVAGNIIDVLSTPSFGFSTEGYISVHRRIFNRVFKFAGRIRDYDISKKEWVLRGDSVNYLNHEDIRRALDYDIAQERDFSYSGLPQDEVIDHIARFISGLWQIHAFAEGNTRTTAVFAVLYLRSIGFEADNDLFAKHSWYFRNALVRANYRNVQKGVEYDYSFLHIFFRNLLFDEQHPLLNRTMLINLTDEEKAMLSVSEPPASTPTSTPASTPASISSFEFKVSQLTDPVKRVILALGEQQLSQVQLREAVGLKDRNTFVEYSLTPALKAKVIRLLYPNSPRHPRQKYLLTVKGVLYYNYLKTR